MSAAFLRQRRYSCGENTSLDAVLRGVEYLSREAGVGAHRTLCAPCEHLGCTG